MKKGRSFYYCVNCSKQIHRDIDAVEHEKKGHIVHANSDKLTQKEWEHCSKEISDYLYEDENENL